MNGIMKCVTFERMRASTPYPVGFGIRVVSESSKFECKFREAVMGFFDRRKTCDVR